MKTVGDLPRLWRALPGSLRVKSATIAVDDLDLGVLAQPLRGLSGQTLKQHIDNLASLQIYDNSSIAEPFTPGPVVDSRYANGLRGAESGDTAFQLQQNGVVTDRHVKTLHQTLSWQAADAMTKKVKEFSDSLGSACVTRSNFGQLINECPALAIFVAASPSI